MHLEYQTVMWLTLALQLWLSFKLQLTVEIAAVDLDVYDALLSVQEVA